MVLYMMGIETRIRHFAVLLVLEVFKAIVPTGFKAGFATIVA